MPAGRGSKVALAMVAALSQAGLSQAENTLEEEFLDRTFIGNVQRTQVFDDAPDWTATRTVDATTGANFGYRASDHTGGKSAGGEIGGTISSADTSAYYADVAYRIEMTLNEALTAEGEFDFAQTESTYFGDVFGGAVLIGHRNEAPAADRVSLDNFLGIELTGDQGTALRARAMLLVAGGDSPRYGEPITGLTSDGDYRFRYNLFESFRRRVIRWRCWQRSSTSRFSARRLRRRWAIRTDRKVAARPTMRWRCSRF